MEKFLSLIEVQLTSIGEFLVSFIRYVNQKFSQQFKKFWSPISEVISDLTSELLSGLK